MSEVPFDAQLETMQTVMERGMSIAEGREFLDRILSQEGSLKKAPRKELSRLLGILKRFNSTLEIYFGTVESIRRMFRLKDVADIDNVIEQTDSAATKLEGLVANLDSAHIEALCREEAIQQIPALVRTISQLPRELQTARPASDIEPLVRRTNEALRQIGLLIQRLKAIRRVKS